MLESRAMPIGDATTRREVLSSTRTWSFLAGGGLGFLVFWARGVAHLFTRHPHEDAFILFRYVEHFARGLGIVYNAQGPHAEGATDFLWMVMLTVGVRLGADVAVCAVFLNGLGSALLACCLLHLTGLAGAGRRGLLPAVLIGFAVPFLPNAHAAYDGFSTQLYCGLVALCLCLYLSEHGRGKGALVYVALALGLFRPDGVVIGGGLALLSLVRTRTPDERKALWLHAGIAVALGCAYFVWRWNYFGELLPLPLSVKSHGQGFAPGWAEQWAWLKNGNGPVALLACASAMTWFCKRRERDSTSTVLHAWLGLVPAGVLFAMLTFAYQSQNVDYRFQAPIFISVLAVLTYLCAFLSARLPTNRRGVVWSALVLILVPALITGRHVWPLEYMDSFAVRFGAAFPEGSVALTEAGRMAFWTDADVHDMVGLNTAHTARRPATLAYVRELNPDVVMYHMAGTLDRKRLRPAVTSETKAVVLKSSSLESAVHRSFRPYLRDLGSYDEADVTTMKLGSLSLTRFLAHAGSEYEVYGVRYGDVVSHVFAFRRTHAASSSLRELVLSSQDAPYLSYAAARKLRGHRRACRATRALAKWWGPEALGLPELPSCSVKVRKATVSH